MSTMVNQANKQNSCSRFSPLPVTTKEKRSESLFCFVHLIHHGSTILDSIDKFKGKSKKKKFKLELKQYTVWKRATQETTNKINNVSKEKIMTMRIQIFAKTFAKRNVLHGLAESNLGKREVEGIRR